MGPEDASPASADGERAAVLACAQQSREAAGRLAQLPRAVKDAALHAIADAVDKHATDILAANADDVAAAQQQGSPAGMVDRLTLTGDRLTDIAGATRGVADLPDPVGDVIRGSRLPNGLTLRQIRVPLGVVGIIYEARPNVTVDAAALCLKSGNAVLLRGSSTAQRSNTALVQVVQDALRRTGLPEHAVQLVPGTSRESARHLMTARGLVDVLIPRGGAGLIASVVNESTVPVIETGIGNCHVYVDRSADVTKAVAVLVNSKAQRTSVCNAAETFLVHADIADAFVPAALAALAEAGVRVHGDDRLARYAPSTPVAFCPVTEEDWATEYYSLDIAGGVVDSIEDALTHIRRYGSGHTEAILADSQTAVETFIAGVDAAAVMVNASTRFTDGGEFGFGAEIGISTQKLHARGPMGLPELTTTTYVVVGDGHVRG